MAERKALIVGCGRIAGGYDEDRRGGEPVTHAGAYRVHEDVTLLACVEPDRQRRKDFAHRWRVKYAFDSLDAYLESGIPVDVASVCAPDETHAGMLDRLLEAPVQAVLCEKPLALALDDARRVASAYAAKGRALSVNYTRRFNPWITSLVRDVSDGRYGKLRDIVGWYGKGIVHNGSHLIDLVQRLAGKLETVGASAPIDDGRNEDPTVDARLVGDRGVSIHLIGVDHRDYDFFELTILCEAAVLSIEEGGRRLRVRPVEPDPDFSGHRRPGVGTCYDLAAPDVMRRTIDDLFAHLDHGTPLASDAASAVRTQEICERIRALALGS